MAISFVNAATGGSLVQNDTLVIPALSGTAANDVAFVAISGRDDSSDNIAAPTGWQRVATGNPTNPGFAFRYWIYARIITSSEPASYSFQLGVPGDTFDGSEWVILAYRGVFVGNGLAYIWDTAGATFDEVASPITLPSLTTATSGAWRVDFCFASASGAILTPSTSPTASTERADAGNGGLATSRAAVAVQDVNLGSPTTDNARTITLSTTSSLGYSRALKPGAGESPPTAGDRYVRAGATGLGTGLNWTDAWTSFSAIDWTQLTAGATLTIGAGTYTPPLNFTSASRVGTADAPLRVATSRDATYGGRVYLRGGRSRSGVYEHLPTYGQAASTYTAPTLGSATAGFQFGSSTTNYAQHVVVDGLDWDHCFVVDGIGLSTDSRASTSNNGTTSAGLDFCYNSDDITVKYVVSIDIGNYIYSSTDAYNSVTGVVETNVGYNAMVCGSNVTFDHVVLLNPAQDNFKQRGSGSSIGGYFNNWTIRNVWAGNTRRNAVGAYAGRGFNDGDLTNASHADTMQLFTDKRTDDGKGTATKVLSGLHFSNCVFGPNTRSGGQMGEPNVVGLSNVDYTDVLWYGSWSWSCQSLPTGSGAADSNWTLTRITSDRPNASWSSTGNGSMEFNPSTGVTGFSITDSVFYGPTTSATLTLPSTTSPTYSGNYRFNEGGGLSTSLMPTTGDPGYADRTSHGATWIDADFALDGSGQAVTKGSQTTSVLDIAGRTNVGFWVTVPLATAATGEKVPDFKSILKQTGYVVAAQSATEALCLLRRPELIRLVMDPIYTPEVFTTLWGKDDPSIDANLATEAARLGAVGFARTAHALPAS